MKRYDPPNAHLLSAWSWFSNDVLQTDKLGVTDEMFSFYGGAAVVITILSHAVDHTDIEGVKIALSNLQTETEAFEMLLQDLQKRHAP